MMADAEILLAGPGASSDVRTQSGRPFFLLESAGANENQSWEGLDLDTSGLLWTLRRYAWNASSLLAGRGSGGYQFSEEFLERLWRPVQHRLTDCHVLTWSVLYPSSVVDNDRIVRSFYIDQTLGQSLVGYGLSAAISRRVAVSALNRERLGYARAHAIITTSEWGRRGVLETNPDVKDRAHVVLPGANLPLAPYRSWAATQSLQPSDPSRPLRLLFIGLHAIRKGLDRLLRAMALAREAGSNIELTVIGCMPRDVAASARGMAGVKWVGRLDKIAEFSRILSIAEQQDVGCLLSRAEAGGIGLREFQALGLGVLAPDVGGSPEFVSAGAGELVGPEASDEAIAALLSDLERDRSRVDAMRAAAWEAREDVLWPRAARQISQILRAAEGRPSADGFA